MLIKKFGWIVFILMVLYFIFLIRQDIISNLELKKEAERAAAGIQREEKRIKEYQGRLKGMQRADYVELLARSRLGLIKKGETAYKVIGGEN
ncbi:MAG: septum formation initiator family protein [Candidatus Margulisiibacteriota bacterium]